MSDYIAELRRELVGAAERERRRRAPRRALRRARRPLTLGLAGAAALAALVLGIVRELPTPSPAGPRVVATIRLGDIPVGAATGAGRVWVSDNSGSVLVLDPKSRRRIATIATGNAAASIAASDDAVWVVAAGDHAEEDTGSCASIRRATASSHGSLPSACSARPLRPRPMPPGCRRPSRIPGRSAGSILRPTGSAATTGGMASPPWPAARAALDAWLDGVLEWRDARTGRVLGALDGFAPNPAGRTWRSGIAPDGDGRRWSARRTGP